MAFEFPMRPDMSEGLAIRNMTRAEVDELVAWAAREGWNPGLRDAEIFWATDPEAFVAARLGSELIGGGAITAYAGEFGFMGFFIVQPEYRGRGLGDLLWQARLARLRARLRPGAGIGLDGVFAMQAYYARGGFVFSHRNMRFRIVGTSRACAAAPCDALASVSTRAPGAAKPSEYRVVPLAQIPVDRVLEYDRTCFPVPRPTFVREWITQPDALAVGCLRNTTLAGSAVVRRCVEGCKIGPLFADDEQAAAALYAPLQDFAAGGSLFLDAPENNPAAMRFVRERGMTEVFGCARMYLGPAPQIAHQRVFGVTTFELG